jgi:hypothetical protein
VQDVAAERGQFKKTMFTGLSEKTERQKILLQLLALFVLAHRATHKNQHSDVVSCIFAFKMHVAWLLSLSLWNGEQSNSFMW